MQDITVEDTDRRAFLGFVFLESDFCTSSSFELTWEDDRKEEIIEGEREDPIEMIIYMN